jgi:integrase
MSRRRRESPIKRVNPSGKERWVARYTKPDGTYGYAGTFARKHEAQDAIEAAYCQEEKGAPELVGTYAATWTERHPRGERTNKTNDHRLSRVLDVEVEGRRLRDWPFRDLRRRHSLELVAHMLTVQGRAATGARNVLRTLSAMAEDAITDEIADVNSFRGVRVRANDPRARKPQREPRVFTFDQMHAFAAAAGQWEPLVRVIADCGLRLGEVLGLDRSDFDGETFRLRGAAHNGVFVPGDQATKRHVRDAPCPPSTAALVRAMPTRIDTTLLFPTITGKLWWERNFYRDVWEPARQRSGIDCTPQEFRHSWVSLLRAEGIDPADLADAAGHSLDTATGRYTHALRRSHNQIRRVIG